MPRQRFFLSRDNDGHWYLVDAHYRKEWEEFVEYAAESENSDGETPPFASRLNGSLSSIEFENPLEME